MNIVKREVSRLTNSEFAKNVLTMFTGISFSQIIPIIVSPILTRLYSPEDFGVLALFTSTGMFFGNIATFHYDAAIMLPEDDEDALNVFALSLVLTLATTLFTAVLVVLFNTQLANLMNNQRIEVWLYLVPVSVFLTGTFRTFSVWSSRKKEFRLLAARNITQTTTKAGTKLISGFANFTSGGLIVGSIIGQFVATTLLAFQSFKRQTSHAGVLRLNIIKANAIKYKDFPLYTNWQGFGDIFNKTGTNYVISNLLNSKILGHYTFTLNIIQRPLQIIGQSLSQVFYQKAAQSYNQGKNLQVYVKKIVLRLLIIGFPIFVPVIIFGPQIFSFVFGHNWAEAGTYAQIFTPWLYIKFIGAPTTTIPQILKKQKEFFLISLVRNVFTPLLFFLFLSIETIFINTLIYIVLFNFIISLGTLFWMFRISKRTD